MRVLILGGNGMLGHELLLGLPDHYEKRVTLRSAQQEYERFGIFNSGNSYFNVELRDTPAILRVMNDFGPDAVVNAAGIIKQRGIIRDSINSIEVNSLMPHRLSEICVERGIRLVHFSTDCVFSGVKGLYTEDDLPDAEDLYGRSKLMGEVIGPGVFTLRTSLIGRELQRRKSLMDWFLSQWPGPVKGFKRAIFSGFTTLETTRIVQLVLEKGPDEGGLWHVSSEPVDKYTLLRMIKQEFGFDIEIKPDENVVIDRSLNSARFREQFNYSPPSWKEMIADYFTHVQNAPAGLYEPYGKKRNEDAVAPETRDNASRKTTSTMPARARKSDYLSGKTVLVTGGTGSMGRTFVHRTLSGEMGVPKKVIVFSRDEAKQHAMRMAYQNRIAATDETIYDNFRNTLEFRIGDLRSYADVCAAVKDADIVINAAAMKQVPSCEYFPVQAVSTNCLGAENIVRAVRENGYGVQTVVGISTDKACKPVNAMGMTKALQERIFISANLSCPDTRFIAVRYGNVLASRGSVIPLFHEQIRNGGPVTITVPEMTRFLMSIDQAVDTVFAALEDAKRGEIYIPIAPAATVLNTARAMIGERDIPIKVIGVRPGEKMHEILISEEESSRSIGRGDYFVIQPMLPELKGGQARSSKVPGHEFSSADTVLDPEGTRSLLAKHGLLGDTALRNVFGEMVA